MEKNYVALFAKHRRIKPFQLFVIDKGEGVSCFFDKEFNLRENNNGQKCHPGVTLNLLTGKIAIKKGRE